MADTPIRFGGTGGDYLTVTVHGRNIPEATDFWHGNFLWCTAEVVVGDFRGSVGSPLRNEDLMRFLPQLERLDRQPDTKALFDTLDGWLDVWVEVVGQQIEARGSLCDGPIECNQLEFRLRFDRTVLPALITQVRAAVEAYPVLGQSD